MKCFLFSYLFSEIALCNLSSFPRFSFFHCRKTSVRLLLVEQMDVLVTEILHKILTLGVGLLVWCLLFLACTLPVACLHLNVKIMIYEPKESHSFL